MLQTHSNFKHFANEQNEESQFRSPIVNDTLQESFVVSYSLQRKEIRKPALFLR